MECYKNGGCGVYENRSCSECPASKPTYVTGISGKFKPVAMEVSVKIDRDELKKLGFDDFPDSKDLIAAIHEAIFLADARV